MRAKFAAFIAILFCFTSITYVFAQGEATVLFMMINAGARQGGMGEAGVGFCVSCTGME